jgi:hypothetical protein|nr:MAG TPA: hypothetical protein [Caudoviricetes sp.]
MPTVENAASWFNAKTVTHHLDVVDTCTADGSTVRFYNACGFEFMTLKSDDVSTRFGLILDHEVEKVTVSSQPAGLCVSFVVSRWFEEGLDKVSIVLSPAASVELKSEIGAVSVIEETDTTSDVITSFYEDETSDEPWLVIVEPR